MKDQRWRRRRSAARTDGKRRPLLSCTRIGKFRVSVKEVKQGRERVKRELLGRTEDLFQGLENGVLAVEVEAAVDAVVEDGEPSRLGPLVRVSLVLVSSKVPGSSRPSLSGILPPARAGELTSAEQGQPDLRTTGGRGDVRWSGG